MDESFRIAQLTKELVAQKVQKMEDPCAVAADLVKQTIVVALGAKPEDAEKVVSDACYGGLQGLYLSEQSLPRGALFILEAVAEAAGKVEQDPTALMQAALKGFARIKHLTTPDQLFAIRSEIEKSFNGTGEAFSAALAEIPDPGARQHA